MINNNITNYDSKLAFSIQQDYLLSASKYRLAKEVNDESNLLNTSYKFILSFVAVAFIVSAFTG
ncbi:MAG: hypothetical protein ACI9EW_004094 [Cellvibrionaceae bacterium]|jgi:hypothetical protein